MISALKKETLEQYISLARNSPGIGTLLEVNSWLFVEKQNWLHFYLCEEGALMLRGRDAFLVGGAESEELACLLEFLGIERLLSKNTVPWGWKKQRTMYQMEYIGNEFVPHLPQGIEIDVSPSAMDVVKLLESEGISVRNTEDFYSELCTKRNHSVATVWAAIMEQKFVATAGAYAIANGWAYLAEVVTLLEFRNKGIGSALCGALGKELHRQGNKVALLCSTEKEEFYKRAGFVTKEKWCITCKGE